MEDIYKTIVEVLQKGERASLATVIARKGSTPACIGFKMLVLSNGEILGTVGGGCIESEIRNIAIEVMESRISRLFSFELNDENSICGGSMEVFIEPIITSEKLYIFGAGHIGQALSKIAAMTGFNVIIIDDREEYANRERFPEAHNIIVSDFGDSFQQLEIDDNSFIVIVTRGHTYDELVLGLACQTKAKYIGMIGSKKKIQSVFNNLRQKGISNEKLSEIHAPIGLDIGSETPSEIAVSILAEMIQFRHSSESK